MIDLCEFFWIDVWSKKCPKNMSEFDLFHNCGGGGAIFSCVKGVNVRVTKAIHNPKSISHGH